MSNVVNIPASQATTGVFISAQSLTTFPVATSMVTMIWRMMAQIQPSFAQNKLIPIIIAFGVGTIIYFYSESPSSTTKEKIMEVITGILNSLMIASASLGIMSF